MENEKKNPKAQLSRFPQDLIFDYNCFDRNFGEEANIIRDIALYCVNDKIRNNTLWNETTITIEDFAKEFNYSRSKLSRLRFPENDSLPVKKKKDLTLGDHKFENIFEYALLRAMRENIIVPKRYKDENGNLVEEFHSYRIIEELRCNINDNDTKKKRKQVYTISLSSELLNGILGAHKKYYLVNYDNYKSIKSLTSTNIQGYKRRMLLQIFEMIHFAQYAQKTGIPADLTRPLDTCAEILGIKIADMKDRKKKVAKYLDDIQAEAGNFTYSFVTKKDERFKYYVEFSFPPEVLAEHKESQLYKDMLDSVMKGFMDGLANVWIRGNEKFAAEYNLLKTIKEKNAFIEKVIDSEDFQHWFYSRIQDPEYKESYSNYYKEMYKAVSGKDWPEDKEITFNL